MQTGGWTFGVVLLLLSGCVANQTGTAPAAAKQAPTASKVIADAIHMAGTTGTGACFGTSIGLSQCRFPTYGNNAFQPIHASDGKPIRLAGKLTTASQGKAAIILGAAVLYQEGGQWQFDEDVPVQEGLSPVSLDFNVSKLRGPLALSFYAGRGDGTAVGWMTAFTGVDFEFDGTLTSTSA